MTLDGSAAEITEKYMQLDYFIFYAESNIICIIIMAIILISDRLYGTRQEKQIWFNRAIIAYILYFLSDIGWDAVINGQLPRVRILVELFNLTNYILIGVTTYEWFMFMAASEKMPFRNVRKKRLMCLLPLVVSVLAILIAYAAAPNYWINESSELNDAYYLMMLAAPAFYLIVSFVISMRNARKAETKEDIKLCLLIGIFPLGVMAFGLVQVFSLNAPTFCFGCTVMLLYFYIQNMQTLVSLDALTRLNNRGQINRYMEQIQFRENSDVFIMMLDIDGFKQINDTYGHAEGDRALVLVAEALKQTCDPLRAAAFLGRYGGDEFTVILQNPEEDETPEHVAALIRSTLHEKWEESRLPYDLEFSIGYDALRGRDDTMDACMIRADEKLYEEKRRKGTLR